MDHLLVAGFNIGQEIAPSAALRERARRAGKKINGVRFARNRCANPIRGHRALRIHA
jgi:hypothetical protein